MPKFLDLSGQRFGRLTALDCIERASMPGSDSRWRCLCECGNETVVTRGNLKNDSTQSCGCLRNVQGGFANKHPLWRRWTSMIRRCENPSDKDFRNYGARGITVCNRWHSFPLFLADMESSFFEGATLERVNNDGNYEPSNVKWASSNEQWRNKRTKVAYIDTPWGRMACVDAANKMGIPAPRFYDRVRDGWSYERLFDPANARKLHKSYSKTTS